MLQRFTAPSKINIRETMVCWSLLFFGAPGNGTMQPSFVCSLSCKCTGNEMKMMCHVDCLIVSLLWHASLEFISHKLQKNWKLILCTTYLHLMCTIIIITGPCQITVGRNIRHVGADFIFRHLALRNTYIYSYKKNQAFWE